MKSHDAGQADQPEIADGSGVEQPLQRLPGDQQRAQRDHHHHEEAREVLGPAISIGVPAIGCPSPDDEGDPQRHRCQGVAEVVDGVRKQRRRAGLEDDEQLQDGREHERQQRDLDGEDALAARFEGAVEAGCRIMAVGRQEVA